MQPSRPVTNRNSLKAAHLTEGVHTGIVCNFAASKRLLTIGSRGVIDKAQHIRHEYVGDGEDPG
jgi:hypothetical protein